MHLQPTVYFVIINSIHCCIYNGNTCKNVELDSLISQRFRFKSCGLELACRAYFFDFFTKCCLFPAKFKTINLCSKPPETSFKCGISLCPTTLQYSDHYQIKQDSLCYLYQHFRDEGKDYFGGQRCSSRNSSILLVSVFTSLLYNRKGGCAPGARSFKMSGFLKAARKKKTDGIESESEQRKTKKGKKGVERFPTAGNYPCEQLQCVQLSPKIKAWQLFIF